VGEEIAAMTTVEHEKMLRAELDRALAETCSVARLFLGFVKEEKPEPADLADAADELYLKVGRVAGFARMLARESGA
jgi:hypothetical protein